MCILLCSCIFVLSIKLYDNNGVILRQLPDGLYLLHVHDGVTAKPEIHKIIVEH